MRSCRDPNLLPRRAHHLNRHLGVPGAFQGRQRPYVGSRLFSPTAWFAVACGRPSELGRRCSPIGLEVKSPRGAGRRASRFELAPARGPWRAYVTYSPRDKRETNRLGSQPGRTGSSRASNCTNRAVLCFPRLRMRPTAYALPIVCGVEAALASASMFVAVAKFAELGKPTLRRPKMSLSQTKRQKRQVRKMLLSRRDAAFFSASTSIFKTANDRHFRVHVTAPVGSNLMPKTWQPRQSHCERRDREPK